jgi:hypothetical protein
MSLERINSIFISIAKAIPRKSGLIIIARMFSEKELRRQVPTVHIHISAYSQAEEELRQECRTGFVPVAKPQSIEDVRTSINL